jgi:nucleoid DNA-binding protein
MKESDKPDRVRLQHIQEHVEARLGLDKTDILKVLLATAELMVITLTQGKSFHWPNVGRFSVVKNSHRDRILFSPASKLRLSVKYPSSKITTKLDQDPTKKKEQQEDKYLTRLQQQKTDPQSDIERNLLIYLQTRFIWGKPWKHPVISKKFPALLVQEKLGILRQTDPKGYDAIFLLWMSLSGRKRQARQQGLTESQLEHLWRKSINKLLLLLLFPDLSADIIETLKANSNGQRDARISSLRESSECNGIHRAAGISDEVSRILGGEVSSRTWGIGSDYWSSQELI